MKVIFLVVLLTVVSSVAAWRPGGWFPAPSQSNAQSTSEETVHEPLISPIDSHAFAKGIPDFSHDSAASFHEHGNQVCASGCSLSRHPTDRLSKRRFLALLAQAAAADLNADNLAFETLLYFGRQTSSMIAACGTPHLTDVAARVLADELGRQHARVSIRVIDEHGKKCSWTDDVRVPLDRRHVFDMSTDGLPPIVTSGTVKRVGHDHLWTRL